MLKISSITLQKLAFRGGSAFPLPPAGVEYLPLDPTIEVEEKSRSAIIVKTSISTKRDLPLITGESPYLKIISLFVLLHTQLTVLQHLLQYDQLLLQSP